MKSKLFKRIASAVLAFVVLALPFAALATIDSPTSITTALRVKETNSAQLGSGTWLYTADWTKAFANGTGNNQVNKVYIDTETLAGSGTLSLDLDSTLTGPLGSVTFSRIVAVCARRTNEYAATTQDENVTVGGDFILTKYLLGWVDDALTIPIHPAGVWCWIAPSPTGVVVTASTGDVVLFTNTTDSTTLEVLVLGS